MGILQDSKGVPANISKPYRFVAKAKHEDDRTSDQRNDGQPRSPLIDGKRTVAEIAADFEKGTDPKGEKIRQLMHEGYPQEQAIAIAYSEERAGKI